MLSLIGSTTNSVKVSSPLHRGEETPLLCLSMKRKIKDKLPIIKVIRVQVESTEGTTCSSWSSDKKVQKILKMEKDPLKWFNDLLNECKTHYPEGMGG